MASFDPISMNRSTRSCCSLLTSGPISVASSDPSPSTIADARSTNAFTASSYSGRSTNTRVPAEQISPWFQNTPFAEPSNAVARSASPKTMFGDLPPSSSVTRFSVSAPVRMMILPTSRDPVKATLSTFGLCTSGAPAVSPKPVSTWNTPRGSPASSRIAGSCRQVSGVCSGGLRMNVHPAASAGASFCVAIISG